MTRLSEVGAGFAEEGPEEVKVKRYEASPQLIYKDEDGCRYKTKVEISHGKPNKLNQLLEKGYEVHIATSLTQPINELENLGFQIHPI